MSFLRPLSLCTSVGLALVASTCIFTGRAGASQGWVVQNSSAFTTASPAAKHLLVTALVRDVTTNTGFTSYSTSAAAGDTLLYKIMYANGGHALTQFRISHTLSRGERFSGYRFCRPACSVKGNTIVFSHLTLKAHAKHPGATRFRVTVASSYRGTLATSVVYRVKGDRVHSSNTVEISIGATPIPNSSCSNAPLGPATGTNVYALGDLILTNTGAQGTVVAGGNVQLSNYTAGSSLGTTSQTTLVAAGNLSFTNGTINGNALYGGTGKFSGVAFGPLNRASQSSPTSFAGDNSSLRTLSTTYGALRANGVTTGRYGGIRLQGSDATLNVFTISDNELSTANSLSARVPAGSTILINVTGAADRMRAFGFSYQGVNAAHVLFSFPNAHSLIIQNISIPGSILAPTAAVTFTNGNINGTLVAGSLTGSGGANAAPFTGCLPLK